ncbi:hypothetical protein D3C78_1320400 [compost metagenome]
MGDAGVVDQHVDAAEALDGQRHRAAHRLGVGDVAAQAEGLGVEVLLQVLGETVQRGLVEVEDHQLRPGLGEAQHQRPADSRAAAGDQRHLVLVDLAGEDLAPHCRFPRRGRAEQRVKCAVAATMLSSIQA